MFNIWPHAYYIYGGCEICRNARDIDEEGSDCLVGLETSWDLVSWPILRQKEFGGSYDDQMYYAIFTCLFEGPQRRPEGGEWESIKTFAEAKVRLISQLRTLPLEP